MLVPGPPIDWASATLQFTNTDIGILEVWTKQDAGWKLLARQGFKLPVA